MRWPWHNLWIRAFPELELFKTDDEREHAFTNAQELPPSLRATRFLLTMLVGFVAFAVAMCLVPSLPYPLKYVLFVLLFALGMIWLWWYYRKEIRRELRRRLARRGIPICIKCGYKLRGLTDPRCPECGQPFDPNLLHTIPHDTDPK